MPWTICPSIQKGYRPNARSSRRRLDSEVAPMRIIIPRFHGHTVLWRVGDGLATTLGVRWPLSRLRRFHTDPPEHSRPPRRTPLRGAFRGCVSGANRASSWSVTLRIRPGSPCSRGSVDADEVEGPELGKNATKPTAAERILRTSGRVWVGVEPSAGLWITCGWIAAQALCVDGDDGFCPSLRGGESPVGPRRGRRSFEGRFEAIERQAVHR